MPSDEIKALKDGGWREIAAIDAALESGEIDEEGWHRAMAGLVVPGYLAAETPWGQSGKSGDEALWEEARSHIADAIDRNGTFLDVGCASGFLMECIVRWSPHRVEPYGLEIAPGMRSPGIRPSGSISFEPDSTTSPRRGGATWLRIYSGSAIG